MVSPSFCLLSFSAFLFFFLLSTTGPRQHALPHDSSGDSPSPRVSGDSRATPPPTKPPGDLLPPPPHSVAVSCPPSLSRVLHRRLSSHPSPFVAFVCVKKKKIKSFAKQKKP
ncbi:hypothetical protein DY000_02002722 [Brassica cretica]|uniref:Secreted protein n=1 Tax=Brassica cretica TaxID=69181 RepID=A0ABQ7BYM2_BRACR|nr:hypothetical protein DY000_02002722 [Brassica cretica]